MRIAINCRSILLSQRTGIGRYTYHLLDSLGKIDHANAYILHAPKRLLDFKRHLPDFSNYKNFTGRVDLFQRGAGISDIYHLPCPDKIGPFSGRLIVTIHDLIYKTYPHGHNPQTIELTDKYMQALKARADGFICISENTRRDLHDLLGIPLDRSTVVTNGVDHGIFYPLSSLERKMAAQELKGLGVDRPFVLYVGTIEPRKNLTGLLESFARLKDAKAFHGQMVVAGMKGWMVESIGELVRALGLSKDVVFTGFVSDGQLRQLYNLAEVFVFPSFYEGFGFPILEAFCCGAAVITSGTSSCAEIASKAALTIDPKDTMAMTEAIRQVLNDRVLRDSLGLAGLKRAQEFSFERMARETLVAYQRFLNL